MADKVRSASDALVIVERKLNCFVCRKNFTRPKCLPCLHVFCESCLETLPCRPHQDGKVVKCPVCYSPAQVPKDGISGFPDQFLLRDLGDVPQLLRKVAKNQKVTCENCGKDAAMGFCQQCESFLCQKCIDAHLLLKKMFPDHDIVSMDDVIAAAVQLKPFKKASVLQCLTHKKPLAVYCQAPCDTLVCLDCAVFDHKDHESRPISDENVFQEHKEEIESHLQHTQQQLAFMLQVVQTFSQLRLEISENRDEVKEEILVTAKEMIAKYTEALQQSVSLLEEKADREVKEKQEFLFAQEKDAQRTVDKLQSCADYVEWELRMGSPQHILVDKKQLVDQMKSVTSLISEEKYLVTKKANIKFLKSSGEGTDVGKMESSTYITVSGEGLSTATTARKSSFKLSLCLTACGNYPLSLPAPRISAQLFLPDITFSMDCDVLQTAPGEYEVSYTPVTTGPHQLRVRVGDVDIPGSPFTVQVKRKDTPFRIRGELDSPWGVAVSKDGGVMATEQKGGRVVVIDKEGKVIRSFGRQGSQKGQFDHPRGIAISDDSVFVADSWNDRIQKFDLDGNFIAAVGSKGNGPLQFHHPYGICIGKDGKIFIADGKNRRVQVLNPDLTFSHSFGKEGSQPGEFNVPFCVAVDGKGLVYVADEYNHRVQKFTPEGEFIVKFGKQGTGEGELVRPHGIAVDTITGNVYVSSRHKMSTFNSAGKFVAEFGREGKRETEFNDPNGLALDESTGHLHVCDFLNDRVVMY